MIKFIWEFFFCFNILRMKNFDEWNLLKEKIELLNMQIPFFHEREVWWCSIGLNIGYEQDGKNALFERPVLILRKFNRHTAWILPMTSKNRTGNWYHPYVQQGKIFSILLLQLRLISSKRLQRLIRKISEEEFKQIEEKIIALIKKRNSHIESSSGAKRPNK
ncbi:hypothetical protein A3C09_04640 [Candidatus Uhrbacteria bacterium RIFCSPHIGHO2_02_FULL_47_44]|uniref:Toxin-antitoxin system protein n=1 Tax=Candidatus Uhrbacteria bacterium RIFCSPLOWO2_02_FULL_48_18 TaxID=1802408 RepID=A0A1F7VE58_9BACT|nr:MAG: hypothetical protein A3C09_04640 [Candidatus Uhrbacteria bacterium RIFCSPHIGHO2_02_FULL_47_44]OGL77725.1 MAG: hypothetical protein A3E97_00015 [Candidatus Uhrbacteria bacterium RIFCSPHIGHO2_12_FULL_47_12]OGL80543.1 MAG: hypothetical protein A3B20_04030 [Candidatus Uhrbacteria bacterium RIFCSPLOWO2_01_FULL_47_17]OGL88274.1 MAG: hypothetical protein A3I41_00950 [Candidatus Uhrbacteria bacterium RIFCSPLOWO2_02_FULL_48_18]OGL93182.1 MAG: hypothetical protein A3H12_03130 [Candidatus Uhrbacte